MAMAKRLDVLREYRSEYLATEEPRFVEVGPARYLSIEGKGAPGGAAFDAAVTALHTVAQAVRLAKSRGGRDFKIPALEAIYWAHRDADVSATARGGLSWKLLLRAPPFVGAKDLHEAIAALDRRGKAPATKKVGLETIEEGTCVQALHVGPYGTAREALERMVEAAQSEGLALRGLRHEIYLSDPRRVAPDRLRTIVRQPIGPERTHGHGLNRPARVLAWREVRPGAR